MTEDGARNQFLAKVELGDFKIIQTKVRTQSNPHQTSILINCINLIAKIVFNSLCMLFSFEFNYVSRTAPQI